MRANLRIVFLFHFFVYGLVLLLILITAGFLPALIVALAWGVGLFAHGYFTVVAPELRREWVEAEVRKRLRDEVDLERRTIHERHSRSLEELSASIAHEIRNPITAAKSLVQQMGEDPHSEENLEYARIALAELDRVEASVSHLLRYAREEPLQMSRIELGEVIDSALETLGPRLGESQVRIEREIEGPLPISGDLEKMRRVIINLVANAIDSLEASSVESPVVTVAAGSSLAGTERWIRVEDNGPGIAEEKRARIFDPFFTSKQNGTGLGLAISKKLVETHGGRIEVESTPGEGAAFVLTFPCEARTK